MLIFIFGILFTACQKEDFVPQNDFSDPISETDSGDIFGDDHDHNHGESEEGLLSTYLVKGNEISLIKDIEVPESLLMYQKDKERHQKMWEHVTRLVPLEARGNIAEFEVFHGNGDVAGYVAPIDHEDLSRWKFALAIDIDGDLDELNFQNFFTFVTLHEFGHIVTLNDSQIDLKDEVGCQNYFTGEGCSTKDSYINRIFELGWKDIIDLHNPEFPEETYSKYPDRFHSDYAATNPGEDVAEVFAHFIMINDIPPGVTIAEQKIKLMYEYPELVNLRKQIRERVKVISAKVPNISLRGKIKVCGKNRINTNK